MTRIVCRIATGLALAASSLTTVPVLAQEAPPGDATNGQHVYNAVGCYTCHGRAGQGGAYNGVAPALAKTALPYAAFKFQLRTPANDMPAYSEGIMDEQQIADIYAFVQTLPGRREVKDITILKD